MFIDPTKINVLEVQTVKPEDVWVEDVAGDKDKVGADEAVKANEDKI